ncbi:MAG: MarR family transcriptional regulator [Deltaproteobacteria bacterium]|nr:MarR family transcriptional regulator [Deltaproteobacteria bacterium]
MADDNKISTDCYIFLLSKAYQKGHHLVQKRLEPLGLTNIQYIVLEMLWHEEGLNAVELGKRTNIDKATLSGVLDRMSDAGWINKRRDEGDKRMFRLFPSEKSIRMKGKFKAEREAANEELLSGFTSEERVLLRRLLLGLL